MYILECCAVCGEKERTIVCEFNRLIFLDHMWDNDLSRFDYALCHGCGLVYATRRPDRAEYDFMYENFNEFLMRKQNGNSFQELTAETRSEIDRQFVPWWELRAAPVDGYPVRKRLRREMENLLTYMPHIMLHVPLEGAKVLQVRAKSSTFADFMKRVLGAEQVDLITLFAAHEYLSCKNEGVRSISCLDYENFQIPFDDKYDLIIENHILVHMLNADQTFSSFRSHLNEAAFVFLQAELDDTVLYTKGKNLFAELRPFHFQQFDIPTLKRILTRYGFSVKSVCTRGERDPEIFGVIQLQREPGPCPRIPRSELRARLDMYSRWRDESILSLPQERAEALYGAELNAVWRRVRRYGGVKTNWSGTPAALRAFGEAKIPAEKMAINAAVKRGFAIKVNHWIAGKMSGTRAARLLKTIFRGTKVGRWLGEPSTKKKRFSRKGAKAAL